MSWLSASPLADQLFLSKCVKVSILTPTPPTVNTSFSTRMLRMPRKPSRSMTTQLPSEPEHSLSSTGCQAVSSIKSVRIEASSRSRDTSSRTCSTRLCKVWMDAQCTLDSRARLLEGTIRCRLEANRDKVVDLLRAVNSIKRAAHVTRDQCQTITTTR